MASPTAAMAPDAPLISDSIRLISRTLLKLTSYPE